MRSRKTKLIGLVLAGVTIAVGTMWVTSVRNAALRALRNEQNRSASSELVPTKRLELKPYKGDDVKLIQSAREVRGMASFKDAYYAATGGGLVKLSADGEVLRGYTVLDGLPESDLTAVAVYRDALFIGTRSKGLVQFGESGFTAYRWTDRGAQTVTSMAVSDGDLVIGTFAGGLIRFDGVNFVEAKPSGERIMRITRVVCDGPRVYVGTVDNGLWLYENDTWSHITSTDGLPSNRVVGIAPVDDRVFIATDLGLAVHDASGTRSAADIPMLSDAAVQNDRLILSKDDGELLSFDKAVGTISERGGLKDARLENIGGRLYQQSGSGIAEIDSGHVRSFYKPDAEPLYDNLVSALALGRGSELWVGTFRNGIDVISGATGKTKHIESDAVREINFLEATSEGMRAATTGGLVVLGSDLKAKQILTKTDVLPSNSVTHFTGDIIATARGLAFLNGGKPKVLSTVQGLPNNSVYTTLQVGDKLYAGTLGGLAEIEGHRVTRTYTVSNSGLTKAWVTSLSMAGDRLFIGTYGGGVYELMPSGEIHSFQPETGKFTVNMNAMYSDGDHLYIGTLDGVRVLDLRSQKWMTIRDILPSGNVMSITGDDSAIYFGTSSGIARVEKRHFSNLQK